MSGRPAPKALNSSPQNPLAYFWRDQVINPEHRADNINIAIGFTTFAVGIFAVRNFGGLLVPGF